MQADECPPITERSNPLTSAIDIASPVKIVRLLRASDAQIFSGWRHFTGLYDPSVLLKMRAVAKLMVDVILYNKEHTGKGAIVMSGCGTSGRFACFCSRSYNHILKQYGLSPVFQVRCCTTTISVSLSVCCVSLSLSLCVFLSFSVCLSLLLSRSLFPYHTRY